MLKVEAMQLTFDTVAENEDAAWNSFYHVMCPFFPWRFSFTLFRLCSEQQWDISIAKATSLPTIGGLRDPFGTSHSLAHWSLLAHISNFGPRRNGLEGSKPAAACVRNHPLLQRDQTIRAHMTLQSSGREVRPDCQGL